MGKYNKNAFFCCIVALVVASFPSSWVMAADGDNDQISPMVDNSCELSVIDAGAVVSPESNQAGACSFDLNNDEKQDLADLGILQNSFFSRDNPQNDLNGDGRIDFEDLAIAKSLLPQAGKEAGNAGFVVSWTAPVERTDGTPLSLGELAMFRAYYGAVAGDYEAQQLIPYPETSVVIGNLQHSQLYYVFLTAIDTEGRESDYSEMLTKVAE